VQLAVSMGLLPSALSDVKRDDSSSNQIASGGTRRDDAI
jgi:hypothetical protein